MNKEEYNKKAENFEDNWFFDENYRPTLVQYLKEALQVKPTDKFLDLGCGTGVFTNAVISESHNTLVHGVDVSDNMIAMFNHKNENFRGVVCGLDDYAKQNKSETFDVVLIKEVVHHIKYRKQFFSRMKNQLNPGGQIVIVTRPQEVEFPFFKEALAVFAKQQMSVEELCVDLAKADFKTKVEKKSISVSLPKTRLLKMVKERFMSTFDYFDDEQLAKGLKELEVKYQNEDAIHYKDHLLFVKVTH